jgi:predicted nuclease of predicted toxin-antitoxin system
VLLEATPSYRVPLLFDQNLSPRLVRRLEDLFPRSAHVRDAGLREANDKQVWDFSAAHGYVIVSKDEDFHNLSLRLGHPPKVIWIRRGNCPTREVEAILRRHADEIERFGQDDSVSVLILA